MVVIRMIIGRSLTPLNSSTTMQGVRRRDENSRGKVQNVPGDSSADYGESVFVVAWRVTGHPPPLLAAAST